MFEFLFLLLQIRNQVSNTFVIFQLRYFSDNKKAFQDKTEKTIDSLKNKKKKNVLLVQKNNFLI